MPGSFWLSWPECGRTRSFPAVQFWPLFDNLWAAAKRWLVGERWSAKHQRSASSGWVKARCCLGSEGHERFDWSRSLLEQSAEMSNFVQPHDVGDTNIHACLARPPDKDGQPLGASMSSCRRVGISRRAT
jgi:hypothetical protein